MSRIIYYLFFILNISSLYAERTIGIYDLSYTLKTDLNTKEGVNISWDDVHTVATLQGIVNRNAPLLYVMFVKEGNTDIDYYWLDKYSKKGEWLYGCNLKYYETIEDLVEAYKCYINGAVVYDENIASTSNVASSVSGIENLIAIRYDLDPNSLYSRLILNGPKLNVKIWLINKDGTSMFTARNNEYIPGTSRLSSGSKKNDPYIWFIEKYMKSGLCNTSFGAYYIDQYWKKKPLAAVRNHHTLSNHDFFISKKGFFFDLSPWGDEPATDEPNQEIGMDLKTLKEMLYIAYKQNNNKTMCYIGGFPSWAYKYTKHANGIHDDVPTEWEFTRLISAYNAFKDADAISFGALANASFWQHFPTKEKYQQNWVNDIELKQRGYLNDEGKIDFKRRKFIIFYVGDYDASSWISQKTPIIWDDSNRGKVPLMWCISPVLAERVPHVMHYLRTTASNKDYFAASDNGAGYLMPSMLEEPREISGIPSGLNLWEKHCKKYYEKWGLSITGFIIDGTTKGLSRKGYECYSKFSPNGIVPQKSKLLDYYNDMPILKADLDINDADPKIAAKKIVDRVNERDFIPFHWFRNILKSPTWYCELINEIKLLDDSIELLDAPTFFELLRIYASEKSKN